MVERGRLGEGGCTAGGGGGGGVGWGLGVAPQDAVKASRERRVKRSIYPMYGV